MRPLRLCECFGTLIFGALQQNATFKKQTVVVSQTWQLGMSTIKTAVRRLIGCAPPLKWPIDRHRDSSNLGKGPKMKNKLRKSIMTWLAGAALAAAVAAPAAGENLYVIPTSSHDGDRYALDIDTLDFGIAKTGESYVYAQFLKIDTSGESSKFHLSTLAESCKAQNGRVKLVADDGTKQIMLWTSSGKQMIDATTIALCAAAVATVESKLAKPAKLKEVL